MLLELSLRYGQNSRVREPKLAKFSYPTQRLGDCSKQEADCPIGGEYRRSSGLGSANHALRFQTRKLRLKIVLIARSKDDIRTLLT